MSATGLNFYFDLLGIRDDAFSIYYTFDAFSGANIIPSVSGGNGQFYGTVMGSTGAFGISESSGIFNGFNYIQPNINNNLTGKNWSQFFVFEKTGTATGTLFSSLVNQTGNSGYEIGINDANKLYFRYNSGSPAYYTFDKILANRNAINISLSNSILEFDHYNFNTRKFESQSFIIKDKLFFNSNQWSIGKGFSGAIDDWCYFSGNVSKSNREKLFSGFYSLLDLSSGSRLTMTGYNRFRVGEISGDFKLYTTGIRLFTGYAGYSNSLVQISSPGDLTLFGDFYDNCGNIKPLYLYQGITGVLSSDKILPITGSFITTESSSGSLTPELGLSNSLEITGYLESGIPLYTGVTGVQVIENVTLLDNCGNTNVAYTYNNLTGTISGVTFLPQTGLVLSWNSDLYTYSSGQIVITDAILNTPRSIDSRRIIPFGYNSLTYLWDLQSDETLEFVAFPGSTQIINLDKQAGYDTVKGASILDSQYSSGVINFFLNGQLQQESGVILVGDIYENRLEWQGDYYLQQNLVYGSGYTINDLSFYDYIPLNIRGFKYVTGIETYPLLIGTAHNKNFYLNGQEIYSGNYVLDGQNITLTGGYESVTGVLTFIERYSNEGGVLGVKTLTTGRFLKGTSYMVQNGVRYSAENFIEHSSIDKIGGNNIFAAGDILYNNGGEFWE